MLWFTDGVVVEIHIKETVTPKNVLNEFHVVKESISYQVAKQ